MWILQGQRSSGHDEKNKQKSKEKINGKPTPFKINRDANAVRVGF
jgi:hypothetical protein